jgi:hypothetical protein
MSTFLISILGALGVIMMITILGLILTKIFINRADKAQTRANMISEQPQGVVVDIDDLPEFHQEPGIAVISNDIIESTPHRSLMKKTATVLHQDTHIDHTTTGQIGTYKDLTIPTKTDTNVISLDPNIVDPLTGKITLEY